MNDAISYKRFSSRKQSGGDTDRRQEDLAEQYCKSHHLRLIDTYRDAGLSGFTGEHLTDDSALRALLQAARAGKFRPGTQLIVESLDRLSRQEISVAVRLFLDILDTGLVIVTLIDGEQVFTKERIDNDLTGLIIAIVYLSRANNESKAKQERARQAQQAARKRARDHKIPITAECPRWLALIRRRGRRHFIVNQDRARVVEQVFRMAASGIGMVYIARYLNEHNIATFSGKPKWRPGMIGHLLSNQAVLGRFHPCTSEIENGRRRRVPDPEGPIANYFPTIISDQLYRQARLGTKSRFTQWGKRSVPAYNNLVARIGRCGICGGSLFHTKSMEVWSYLRCSNAHDKDCSNRFGFPYPTLERVLFALDDLTSLITALRPDLATNGNLVARLDNDPDRALFPAAFKAITRSATSSDPSERNAARRELTAQFRRLIEGVVLHANRTVTLHMKADISGCWVVYGIGREGLQGIQVKLPEGTTGFVDGAVLVQAMCSAESDSDTTRQQLAAHIQIVHTPNGDWQAVALAPMQMARLVASAEEALDPARGLRVASSPLLALKPAFSANALKVKPPPSSCRRIANRRWRTDELGVEHGAKDMDG